MASLRRHARRWLLRQHKNRMAEQTQDPQTAFERVQLARHPDRPYTLDFVERLFEDFTEIHGDRRYSDDSAVVCGFARFHGMPTLIVGHQKGRDTKQRQFRNFGMPKPEGYRKAIRAMKLAEKFARPIFTFIDTPGAYPGIDAEERGQAEAIAYNLREMAKLTVPVLVTVIGEGGSGGALAIGVGDQVMMLENSIYSVISPEGCAAILWKDSGQAARAAEELRLTAKDLKSEGIVDQVIDEPKGGAQNSHDEAARLLDVALCERLAESSTHSVEERLTRRYQKLRQMGKWGTRESTNP
ncbi:MAG: acetyl-CoA carboxylase carboxyl transferase subunit alpha [Acidobacteria bacterium]|nr:MAG: acetyl-CoA carboxylase carboxyl transferase subunit alpha [Acidobacteriota bacterium]